MYSTIYFICFVLTFLLLVMFFYTCKKPNIFFCLCFLCALMTNFGFWQCSRAQTASEAELGSKVIYFGAVWVSFFNFMSVSQICKIKIPKWLTAIQITINAMMMIAVLTIGQSGLYYKSLRIKIESGCTHLIKDYGPGHSAYSVFLFAYILAIFILTMIGYKNKHAVSYKYSLTLFLLVFMSVVLFITKSIIHTDFDFLCISYVISVVILIYLQQRIDMFDPDAVMGEDSYSEQKGVVLFNNELQYMGCSQGIGRMIPELRQLNLEYQVTQENNFAYYQILPWAELYKIGNENIIRYIDYKGKSFRCEVKTYYKNDKKMRRLGYIVFLNDDTEQQNYIKNLNATNKQLREKERELQEQKRIAEAASQSKSMFLSNMSHEIRTPMNAIVGMTEILRRKKFDQETDEYLLNIKNSGEALLAIINDILDFSKIESGKMELIEEDYNLRAMLRELDLVFKTRIDDKPIEMKYEIEEDIPYVLKGDSKRIRQILINLVNNAIKFTDRGSVTIKIEKKKIEDKEIVLEVSVIDTGQGIKEEDMGRLFQAYQQVDMKKNSTKEGTGLGLAICKQLISLMKGELKVSSVYGKGSTFSFFIYQTISDSKLEDREEEKDNFFLAREVKILVVDDNIMNLKVFQGLFKPLQMQISLAMNGQEAVEKIVSEDYDMVFMDHMMPIMDGIEATKCIRNMKADEKHTKQYYEEIPIVALTANATEDARRLFEENGLSDFLSKPISVASGLRILRNWLPKEKISEQE